MSTMELIIMSFHFSITSFSLDLPRPIYMVRCQGYRVGWVIGVGLSLVTFFGFHPSTFDLPPIVCPPPYSFSLIYVNDLRTITLDPYMTYYVYTIPFVPGSVIIKHMLVNHWVVRATQ